MLSTLLLSLVLSGRFAVLATASEAPGQAPLRYVEADADRVAAVFEELGGLDAKNVFRVPHATVTSLREALLKAEAAVRSDPNAVLLIYFSGHADEGGLLLGDESFEYRELRQYLKQSSARTRVVLLDGCRTGGAVTAKGGHQGAAFDVRPLQADAITEVISGAAIIAASTATEQAQESSRLEGSFFTHHLVAGLRGAADQNGDGRITLAESYAYAYKQTLSSTSSTLFGPQHAAYQYDLAGTGELTLTELARAEAILSLPLGAP